MRRNYCKDCLRRTYKEPFLSGRCVDCCKKQDKMETVHGILAVSVYCLVGGTIGALVLTGVVDLSDLTGLLVGVVMVLGVVAYGLGSDV